MTETGYGRRSDLSDYRIQSRGGKGLTNYHTEEFGDVAAIQMVEEDDDIILISSDGIIIRMAAEEVRFCRRPAKGVRVMRMEESARIVSLVRAPHEEEAPEGETPAEGEAEPVRGGRSGRIIRNAAARWGTSAAGVRRRAALRLKQRRLVMERTIAALSTPPAAAGSA